MDIDKITKTGDYIERKSETKSGMFVLYLALIVAFCGAVLWLMNGQRVAAIEEKKEAQQQVAESIVREARIKDECTEAIRRNTDECADKMRKYFDMFKELGAQFSGNIAAFQSIEAQTNQTIQQQQSIIQKSTHDEKN